MDFDKTKDIDVILLGRVAIDFNPTDMHRPLNKSRNFNMYLGGSPANIAVGLAKLGKKVGVIAKISDDQFGVFVKDFLDERGIDTSNIVTGQEGESLGLTFTEIKSETESSILMYRTGVADLNLHPSEISEDYIKRAKMLLVSGTALSQSPSREAVFVAIEYAKKHNVKIVFDVDYREYTWANEYEIPVYYSLVAKSSDIILGSREEITLIEALVDKDNSDDLKSAERLFGYGNSIVVIKHGKEGSKCYTSDGKTYTIKPFPVKLLKSFGGGDGYASSFLYSLLEGKSIPEALEFATASASMLVSAHSCSEAMPTVEEVTEFIKLKKMEFGDNVVLESN